MAETKPVEDVVDEVDVDTDDEEDEDESFLEWVQGKLESSKGYKKVRSATRKLMVGGKQAGLIGLKVTWVVFSSAIIVGIPFLFAAEGERMNIEMRQQMAASTGSGAPLGPGGIPTAPGVPPAVPAPLVGGIVPSS